MFNTETQTNIDPNKDYYADLVGEGKKYASNAELAKAIIYKDEHIKTLETENNGMRKDFTEWREQHNAVQNLKEMLDQYKLQQDSSSNHTQANETDNQSQQIDMKDIESLFSNKIKEHEESRRQQENEQSVMSKLKDRYGNNYETHLRTQMDELGMSQEDVVKMVRERPTIFTKLFLQDRQTENFQAPPRNSRSSDSFLPKGAPERNEAYYEQLRRDKPDVYWSPKTQNQMHGDAERLGDAFFV